jgi:hypothetical protein
MTEEQKVFRDACKGCAGLLVLVMIAVAAIALVIGGGLGLVWRVFHWAAG